ncbi:MAG: GGDEF domain-containing protein [Acidobacteriota bacterium]
MAATPTSPPDRTLEPSNALAAIERERFRSYSLLVRNLHYLASALVVLYPLIQPQADRLILWSLASVMMLYTLTLHSRLLARFSVDRRVWIEGWIDLLWITAVVLFSGATESPLFFLYYIVLYESAPAAARRQTYAKAGLASLLMLAVLLPLDGRFGPVGPREEWPALIGHLVWPLIGLWLVAYFCAEAGPLGVSLHRSLYVAAHTDELTGLPNLRFFTTSADLRGSLASAYSIVMVDIDGLKQVNDTYGHGQGSELIRIVADGIRSAARSGDDLCSRIGGDEFIVRLAGTSSDGALAYCRRVRTYLERHPLTVGETQIPVSISTGVAAYPKDGRSLSELTEKADQALYRSKQEGRSRDRVWGA